MPDTPYVDIKIGPDQVEVTSASELGLAINYKLEDSDDFQKKTSDQAFNIRLPATRVNQQIANSYHDPSIQDSTPGQVNRSHKNATIAIDGTEFLRGKAFLLSAYHRGRAEGFEYSFYGGNGDWIVDLKEKTLYDFLNHINFVFDEPTITGSFAYDGTLEALPYVFAPVKYQGPFDPQAGTDNNVDPSYLRPSISPYWLIYWIFKSLGYRVNSTFLNTNYFKRAVMPWTWGNFLDSDGTKLQVHGFLAKSENPEGYWYDNFEGYVNMVVNNDSTDGAFDNNNDYRWLMPITGFPTMEWEYKPPNFGILDATLSAQVSYDCVLVGSNSYCVFQIEWYYFDSATGIPPTVPYHVERIISAAGRDLARTDIVDIKTFYSTHRVKTGDKIYVNFKISIHEGKGIGARARNISSVLAFQLEYFRIPLGGNINFENYLGLKKHKALDFLGGIFDSFDLSVNTDAVNKVVTIEPTHPYSLVHDLSQRSGGYFNGNTLDWTDKRDVVQQWKLELYSDHEREVIFQFKEDGNDGILKKLQDRNLNIINSGKYVLPGRFKAGKKEITNRFFAATTHYDVQAMKAITGIAPQMICMIPENVSNTSHSEAANTFSPKLAWYKGLTAGVGGWKYNGDEHTSYPFMFAVNYKAGGQNDPIFSYSDERIDTVIGKGLLKRFFWSRMAILRNGQFYSAAMFLLNHSDVTRIGHREFKKVDGILYELIEISGYNPTKDEPTSCVLRKWVPIEQIDLDNSYPSTNSLSLSPTTLSDMDIKYAQSIALASDIPQP